MPTGPDEEPPVQDGPGASDASAVPPDGFESFLSAVRGMVHGEDVPAPAVAGDDAEGPEDPYADLDADLDAGPFAGLFAGPDDGSVGVPSLDAPSLDAPSLDAPSPDAPSSDVSSPRVSSPREWVAEDEPSDWLPGTWVVDAPTSPRRKADRGLEKSLARQEKKLREAERRNARAAGKRRRRSAEENAPVGAEGTVETDVPLGRIPTQPGPMTDDRPEARGRRERRQRRRDEVRAQAVSDDVGAELVPSGPAATSEEAAAGAGRTGRAGRKGRGRRAGAGGGTGESGETPTVSGAMSETASMSTLGADPVEKGSDVDADAVSADPLAATQSRAARRAERRQAKQARRADVRAAAIQQQLAAEAARAERDQRAQEAREEKRERRLDAKVARKAATAAKRERRAEEAAARKAAEAEARASRDAEDLPTDEEVADHEGAGGVTRAEAKAARDAEKAAARARKVEEKAARAAALEEERAAERERQAEERAAREAAEAEAAARDRERRAAEKQARAAAHAAARATEERQRRESRLARLEAKATARADKDAQRLARRTAKADARAMAEAEALDRRQDRRARRIETRRTRADAKSAKEIADLERRRERRTRRLEKRSARARAKAREESDRLEQRRVEIERLAPDVPPAEPVTLPGRPTWRERRRDAALAKQLARVAAEGAPTSDATTVDEESLADYLGRVESSILPWRSRRSRSRVPVRVRRAVRIGAVCVLIGGAAVLPWAAPQVAGVIADAVPGGDSHVATVKDPPVAPRTDAIAGPFGIATETNPLDGKRLVSAGWPRQVQVPRLHVDSTVIPISGQSGSLLPPDDPQVLGWWREGRPVGAEFGTAVITGHTVHTGGGALDNLDKLAVGDTLRVRTDDGWITYVVQRAQIYSTAALARNAKDIFRLSGPGRLVVITCDDWNGSFYESNAVVFAAPTSDDPFEGAGVGDVPDPGPSGSS